MKKRILPVLIILVILLGNIIPLASYAVDTTSIEIVNPKEGEILVAPGETFSLDVMLKNPVSGARSLAGFLTYDTEKLEIQNIEEIDDGVYGITDVGTIGDMLNVVMYDAKEPNKVNFTYSNLNNSTLNAGRCFTIKFKVKAGATGTFDVNFLEVKYISGRNDDQEYPINKGEKITGKIKTPLQSISIKNATTLGIGQKEKLNVTYNPTNTTDSKEVTWESNKPTIAKVEADGTITAVAPGEAVITATSKANNQLKATCKVTVTSKLTKISLNKSEIEMAKGQTETLKVTYTPSNTTDLKEVEWSSSEESVATVNENGEITAKALGNTVITATSKANNQLKATCNVKVTSTLKEIKLNEIEFELNKGDKKELKVSYVPYDTTDDKSITWQSSDNSKATIEASGDNGEIGTITAIKPGTVTITAKSSKEGVKPVTATVTIVNHLTGIEIEGGNIAKLLPKQTKNLKIIYTPADTTDSQAITWSSDKADVVSVDSTGKITALKPGTANITARCGNFEDTISVTVPEVHITTIAFKEPEININKNQKVKAEIIYLPENTTDAKTVTFESENPEFATVDAEGNITGVAAGKATIIAKSSVPGVADAVCTVNVKVPLTGIKLNKENITINKGNTDKLEVILNESDTTDDTTITWTSLNPSVAEVSNDGTVTAKSAGTAVIRAQVGKYTVDCQVNVKVPLTGINLKEKTNLYKGQSETLVVEYLPVDATYDGPITWESEDETIATVDNNGKITAKKAGVVDITVTVGEFTKKCQVTVEEIALESIAINNKIDSLLKGQEHQLEVLYLPENTTDDKIVKWSSSDESIVTVTDNGLIKGLKAGKATITIENGDMKDSFEIEIKEVGIAGLEITCEDTNLKPGNTLQLSVDFLPGNTTDSKDLVFSSSDEDILTVDENGLVRALRAGKAVVTVTASNGVQTQIELAVEAEDVAENQTVEKAKLLSTTSSPSPKTGDMNVTLYIILMIISLAGIIITKKTK